MSLPVIFSGRPALPRNGLVAGWDLRNTGDLQTVASTPPGTATLTRGTTVNADTNDATPTLTGHVFDGVDDRILALPAKGTEWTTINCSIYQCNGVDSAGGSWINGVTRAGSVEFDVLTAGGFTSTLSFYYRYNRILNAGEHQRLYASWIRPRMLSVGVTLPPLGEVVANPFSGDFSADFGATI